MSIQKKSLISTLHAAKKANVAKANVVAEHKGEKQVSAIKMGSLRMMKATSLKSLRTTKAV